MKLDSLARQLVRPAGLSCSATREHRCVNQYVFAAVRPPQQIYHQPRSLDDTQPAQFGSGVRLGNIGADLGDHSDYDTSIGDSTGIGNQGPLEDDDADLDTISIGAVGLTQFLLLYCDDRLHLR